MSDPTSRVPARVCPPCHGNCRQGRDCPARSLNDAWADGVERGIDRGFWLGFTVGIVFGFVLGMLVAGVMS